MDEWRECFKGFFNQEVLLIGLSLVLLFVLAVGVLFYLKEKRAAGHCGKTLVFLLVGPKESASKFQGSIRGPIIMLIASVISIYLAIDFLNSYKPNPFLKWLIKLAVTGFAIFSYVLIRKKV